MSSFKNKNKYIKRRVFALIFILFLLMIFGKLIRGNRVNDYKTIFPTLTTFEKDIDTRVYNIFEEKAYYAEGDGVVVFHASEGQKVPSGYEVANLNLMGDVSSLKDELAKIKAAIKIKQGIEPLEKESSKTFTKNLQEQVKNKDFTGVYYDISSTDNGINENINTAELKEYLELSDAALNVKKEELEEKISKYNFSYLTEFSGIVSYKIDGNEEYFDIKDLDKFTYKYLNKNYNFKNLEMETRVKNGDPLFKIMNNLNWKVACTISNVSNIANYNIGDSVKIQIPDIEDIYGVVEKINKDDSHAVIIISLDRYFENMYSNRIHEGKIIVNKTKGFEIPKSTLIERNNLTGVYVQEIRGLVKFVPVDIVSESSDTVFINRGNKQSVFSIGEKSYKTLTVNDAIVINPKTVDESRILNWGDKLDLKDNLKQLYEDIEIAKDKSNFKRDVKLIAVSKTHPVERIEEFNNLGVYDFGENKVQELVSKMEDEKIKEKLKNNELNFHLIGNLQTNKVKYIYNKVKLIQSLDRIKLAKEINKRAKKDEIKVDCLVQINIGNEDSKFGIKYEDTEDFIYELLEFKNINIKGLMAIAPNTEDEVLLRKLFEKMNNKFEEIASKDYENVEMKYLSMGMSHDFKLAIEEGSNMIRVGSKLFGNRNYN